MNNTMLFLDNGFTKSVQVRVSNVNTYQNLSVTCVAKYTHYIS